MPYSNIIWLDVERRKEFDSGGICHDAEVLNTVSAAVMLLRCPLKGASCGILYILVLSLLFMQSLYPLSS